ncbi:MAG: nucleotide exchange factor GrpE, partial [Flavobacteriia bacterium]|nr:nucleotide exchange factor GrpE [Candidatus Bostrichicola ureolyticus]
KDLNKEIDFLIKKIAEEKDRFLRLYAEFENYKKRTQKERLELFKTANKALIMGLLPILDDFERGFEEIKKYKGMILIKDKLMKILEYEGLKKIKVEKGSDFNTDFHEAITQVPANKDNLKNKIMEVVESGYLLQDQVIRYAKVVVSK